MEITNAKTIAFPCRWKLGKMTEEQSINEIDSLSRVLIEGCEAIAGVYMRLCDTIRESEAEDWVIRRSLSKHFSQPRVSEIMRVSRAPDDVYLKYTAGFFGFKAALEACRYYNITPTEHLKRRKVMRAAERLVQLTGGSGELRIRDRLITIMQA